MSIEVSPLQFTRSLFENPEFGSASCGVDDKNSWIIVNPAQDKSWSSIMKSTDSPMPASLHHFAFVNTAARKYTPNFIKSLFSFLKKHLKTLKTIILSFRGALPSHPKETPSSPPPLPILEWKEGELDHLEYLYIGDPKYKITEWNEKEVARFLTQHPNIKHFALLGIDSEKTLDKILVRAVKKFGGNLPRAMYFDYSVGVRTGTPEYIRASISLKDISISPLEFVRSLFLSESGAIPSASTVNEENSWIIVNPAQDKSWSSIMKSTDSPMPASLHHFAFVNAADRKYTPDFIKSLFSFLKKHLKTLKTIILSFRGALPSHPKETPSSPPPLPILEWKEGELDHLEYLYIGDPKYKITKWNKKEVARFLTQHPNIKHFALLGIDSEKTLHKILTHTMEEYGGNLPNTMYFDYSVGIRLGTPLDILSSFSFYSPTVEYPMKRPREYEYTLMAKLVYKLEDRNAIQMMTPKKKSKCDEEDGKDYEFDFFWLTMRGWRCVEYIRESMKEGGHYAGAIFINKYTRQIVLASRGTVFKLKERGSIYADATGIAFNIRNGAQQSAARKFLYQILGRHIKQIEDLDVGPKCVPGKYGSLLGMDYTRNHFYNLSFTGHSLGAWLSEVLVAEACMEGIYTSSVTFDCPGSIKMVREVLNDKSDGSTACDISKLDCIQFVGSPNIVNALHGQVGTDVRCILNTTPKAVENLKGLALALWDWVDIKRLKAFHAMDNFTSAGSRYQKNLVAANHIGRWPAMDGLSFVAISPISIVQSCKSHLRYLDNATLSKFFKERLDSNGKLPLEPSDEWAKISACIHNLSKKCVLRLALPDFYSFSMNRLYPSAQKLVEIYTKLLGLDKVNFFDCIEEHKILFKDITHLENDRVFIQSGVNPAKCMYYLNRFSISKEASNMIHHHVMKMKNLEQVTINEQFKAFKHFLFQEFLGGTGEDMARCLDELSAKTLFMETLCHDTSVVHLTDNITHTHDLEHLANLPELSAEQMQRKFAAGFSHLLQEAVTEATRLVTHAIGSPVPCTYAIVALGSWGKECPLPYHRHKLLIVLEEQGPVQSQVTTYFRAFCSHLIDTCKHVGILLESPLPKSNHTILFGTKNELFRGFVLGIFPMDSKRHDIDVPTSEAEINFCLVRLCIMWDSNSIYGSSSIGDAFKDIIMALMHASDPLTFRNRSRQFMQSFFQQILDHISNLKKLSLMKELSTYGTIEPEHLNALVHFTTPNSSIVNPSSAKLRMRKKIVTGDRHSSLDGERSNPIHLDRRYSLDTEEVGAKINIRQVYINLLNIITYLSLFDRIRSTNPWERIRELIAQGTVSERLGDQLLCSWNIVYTVYTRGQIKSKKAEVTSYEGSDDLFRDIHERTIFNFVKDSFLHEMANKFSKFAKWLESLSPEEISPFHVDEAESCFTEYYTNRAIHLLSSFDTPSFTWSLIQDYCEKVQLHADHSSDSSQHWQMALVTGAISHSLIISNVKKEEEILSTLNALTIEMNKESSHSGESNTEDVKEIFLRILSLSDDITSVMEDIESIFQEWKNKRKEECIKEKGEWVAEQILKKCYYTLLTAAIWKDHPILLGEIRNACVHNIYFNDLVFDCLRNCYSCWEEKLFLFSNRMYEDRLMRILWDLPFNRSGNRMFPEHQERMFLDHLSFISTQDVNPFKDIVKIQYIPDIYASSHKEVTSYLNEEAAAPFITMQGTEFTHMPIIISSPLGELIEYTCHFFSKECVPLAMYSSLRHRISGSSVFPHFVRLSICKGGHLSSYYASFTKNIGNRSTEGNGEGFKITEKSSVQFTLKFLQNLILLPQESKRDILFPLEQPSDIESDHFAFCSKRILDSLNYTYAQSLLHKHPQVQELCHPEAVKIFLSLSPHKVLQSWLSYSQKVIKNQNPLDTDDTMAAHNPTVVVSMFHRFTLLQRILEESASLSHFDVIKMIPDIICDPVLSNEIRLTSCSQFFVDRVSNDSIMTSQLQLDLVYDLQESIDNLNRILKMNRTSKLFDTISSVAGGAQASSQLGQISSLAVHCYTVSSRPFEEEERVISLLSKGNHLQEISFACIPHIETNFLHKVLERSFDTLIVLDLSKTYGLKQTSLKQISKCFHLETLHLNQVAWETFDCSNYSFASLSTLSLEKCEKLQVAILNLSTMPTLRSISFNNSFLFRSLQFSGDSKGKMLYILEVNMMHTCISVESIATLMRSTNSAEVVVKLNEPLPENIRNLSQSNHYVHLQVDDSIVERYGDFVTSLSVDQLPVVIKPNFSSFLRRHTSTAVAAFLGRNTGIASDTITGLLVDRLWNAISDELCTLVKRSSSDESNTAYLLTLSQCCKYMKMKKVRVETAIQLAIEFMVIIISEDSFTFASVTFLDAVLTNLLDRKDVKITHLTFRTLMKLSKQQLQIIREWNQHGKTKNIWQKTMESVEYKSYIRLRRAGGRKTK